MKSKTIIYSTIGTLFLIASYLPYGYLLVWLSSYFIIPSALIFIIALYRAIKLKLPLYMWLWYMGVLNILFFVCGWTLSSILNAYPFNETANAVVYVGTLLSLLVVWYLQVSLLFIKDKAKNNI